MARDSPAALAHGAGWTGRFIRPFFSGRPFDNFAQSDGLARRGLDGEVMVLGGQRPVVSAMQDTGLGDAFRNRMVALSLRDGQTGEISGKELPKTGGRRIVASRLSRALWGR
jgi:hypothetical protein